MRREAAFWDASALVPLLVPEVASRRVRQLARDYGVVTWWGSRVEVRGAICRLFRTKEINTREKQLAEERLGVVWQTWTEVLPQEELREGAERLLQKHPLRAGDSLQLAAALAWCRERPAKRIFLCGDEKLSEAARGEGFAVVELPRGL